MLVISELNLAKEDKLDPVIGRDNEITLYNANTF